jgi:glycosyltransferase involved in cell wall biosynthesis
VTVPQVSVIVPAYNCAPYIASSISSVLSQTTSSLELIVVDDGSTDATPREIAAFDDPRLLVIRSAANHGVAHATNVGIERARGEYLAALAADDVWLPHKLERQIAQLESNRDVDASYTWIQHIDELGTRLPTIERNDLGPDPVATLLTSTRIKLACTLLVRRSAVGRTALLDPRLRTHEDWEYLLRLALAGVRFAGLREPLTLVRQRPGSLSRNGMSADHMRRALANVARLRREYPGRISLPMLARCGLRSLVWVGRCQLRTVMKAAGMHLSGGTAATPSDDVDRTVRAGVPQDSSDS